MGSKVSNCIELDKYVLAIVYCIVPTGLKFSTYCFSIDILTLTGHVEQSSFIKPLTIKTSLKDLFRG